MPRIIISKAVFNALDLAAIGPIKDQEGYKATIQISSDRFEIWIDNEVEDWIKQNMTEGESSNNILERQFNIQRLI